MRARRDKPRTEQYNRTFDFEEKTQHHLLDGICLSDDNIMLVTGDRSSGQVFIEMFTLVNDSPNLKAGEPIKLFQLNAGYTIECKVVSDLSRRFVAVIIADAKHYKS